MNTSFEAKLGGKKMIKITQKRTCAGCKALSQEQYTSDCLLGYKFDRHFKPLEPCPKPKTNDDFCECHRWYKRI